MTSREIVAQVMVYAWPVIASAGMYLATRISLAVQRYFHSKTVDAIVSSIDKAASAAVADVYMHVVKDLKSADKPGEWTDVAARAAKQAAIDHVKAALPGGVKQLQLYGHNSDDMIGQMVEKAVVELNARVSVSPTPLPMSLPMSLPMPAGKS